MMVGEPLVEEWRHIPDTAGLYSVSTLGRVRSEPAANDHRRGQVLRPCPDSKGYLQIKLCVPGRAPRPIKVHRAVALAFLGPRPDGFQINHKSGVKTDNTVSNLEYVTCAENIRHGNRMGLYRRRPRGAANPQAKLTEDQVRDMRTLAPTTSLAEIASRFGISKTNASQIVRRLTWQHVA